MRQNCRNFEVVLELSVHVRRIILSPKFKFVEANPGQIVQEKAQDYVTEDGLRLPHWWMVQKDKEGRTYYINNFKKR